MDTTTWLCGNPPANGQKQRYPGRFEHNLRKYYLKDGMKILTMFSGSVGYGDTTDIRPETGALVVAPYDSLPEYLCDYDIVVADPPYNKGFGAEWKADLPKPKRIARSAMKALKVGGLFLLLHIIVLPAYKDLGMERVALHPVLCGTNNAIRVLNVMRKIKETCRQP